MGFGTFDRTVNGQASDPGAGGSFYTSVSHAQVLNDRWSFKVSGGYFTQDAFARPVGIIDNPFKTPFPSFVNTGTSQPKVDGRLDYDFPDGQQHLSFAGGYGGTSGIIHTGIGPFQIEKGSNMAFGKADYTRGALRVKAFANLLDGTAPALLSVGTDGKPITFLFNTKTYDLEAGNISTIGTHHVLSYGGNARYNSFKLSIAPGKTSRKEGGVYLQDEIFLGSQFRWLVGARLDKFEVLKDVVFSPRTTLMFKPSPSQTFRISYNHAFRAPSLVNNYLDVDVLNQLDLGLLSPAMAGRIYTFPLAAEGNSKTMKQQSLNAYEIGYSSTIRNRASVSLAFYYNDMTDEVFFTQDASYSSANVPPGWPLPPSVSRPADWGRRLRREGSHVRDRAGSALHGPAIALHVPQPRAREVLRHRGRRGRDAHDRRERVLQLLVVAGPEAGFQQIGDQPATEPPGERGPQCERGLVHR